MLAPLVCGMLMLVSHRCVTATHGPVVVVSSNGWHHPIQSLWRRNAAVGIQRQHPPVSKWVFSGVSSFSHFNKKNVQKQHQTERNVAVQLAQLIIRKPFLHLLSCKCSCFCNFLRITVQQKTYHDEMVGFSSDEEMYFSVLRALPQKGKAGFLWGLQFLPFKKKKNVLRVSAGF